MTILDVLREAAPKLGVGVPSAVFGSTRREHVELADVANEVAEEIASAHEWNTLKRLLTITGNGVTDAYDMPADYGRMPKDQKMWSSAIDGPLCGPVPHDDWLELQVRDYSTAYANWTILGGQVVFFPPLGDGETVKVYYQSGLIVRDAEGAVKTRFTADTDEFRLDARTLRLGIVAHWKGNKGLPFEKALVEYHAARAQQISEDRGSRSIRIGRARMPADVRIAYPRSIIP